MNPAFPVMELDTPVSHTYNENDVGRIVELAVSQAIAQYESQRTSLENCTNDAQDTPKEDNSMAYSRQRVFLGYDPQGKPVYRQISGNTQDERDIQVVKAFIESGRIRDYLPADYMTVAPKPEEIEKHPFQKYAWDWYYIYKEKSISTKYKATLEARISRACLFFGNTNIEDIKVQDIQTFLTSMKDFTQGTVGYYRNVVSQILDSAIEDEIIVRNPAKSKRLMIVGTEAQGNQSLSLPECQRLIALLPTLEDKRETMAIALMLLAGLRREEMLGVKWEDIDFEKRLIHVKRAIIIANAGHSEIKTTKNKSSKRYIPMSDELIDIMYPLRKPEGFIVTNKDGSLFIDRQYKTFWDSVRKHTGIPDLKAPVLRHTYATMNAAAGVDMKTVGACMGHSKIATTAEIYTQVEPVHVMDIRNRMSAYIQGDCSPKCAEMTPDLQR